MPLNWQRIEGINQPDPHDPNLGHWIATDRAKVFGGWLVRTYLTSRELAGAPGIATVPEYNTNSSITFIPDPTWQWDV